MVSQAGEGGVHAAVAYPGCVDKCANASNEVPEVGGGGCNCNCNCLQHASRAANQNRASGVQCYSVDSTLRGQESVLLPNLAVQAERGRPPGVPGRRK